MQENTFGQILPI
jgi:chromosome segregation ATPase